MNPSRLVFAIVAGCCLLRPASLPADDIASPFDGKQAFSADMIITTGNGQNITQKIFSDSGKIRSEMNTQGMQIVSILRPDLKKMYSVMVAQKMIMEMPFDTEKAKKQMTTASGPQGKFELVGPDVVDGVACTKYKVTTDDNKVFFFWLNATAKIPVKMMAEDNLVTILWKNYKIGPQDAALFEPPKDYQVMAMPGAPGGSGQ